MMMHPQPSRIPLRVAITGGTSGLGLALVEAFAARGDHVAFVARDAGRVGRVAREIAGSHGIVGDVAKKDVTRTPSRCKSAARSAVLTF